jgi:uncharacterized protein YdaU (DUF1376 family)
MLMQVRGMGDNSAAFGEELRAEIETVLGDDHEAVFHYAQWHIGDYIAGTEGMVLETEGAYIRFLMRLYRRGKPLPDNDSFMATAMGLTTRVWRRVRQVLIEFGKIIVRNGCLTNSRFERERQRRAEEMRKRAESARLRWEKDRSQKAGLPEVSAKFAGSLAEVSSKLPANDAKKANKNNDAPIKVHMLTNNQYPITNKDIPASTSQEAARGMLDEIDGLNGATVLMQNKIAKWMHPVMPRYSEARTWLTNVVQLFGSDIVRDAFAAVEAKQASGDIVPSPIKLMSAICQQKVKAAKADEGKPKPKTFIDSIVLPDKKPRPREEAI